MPSIILFPFININKKIVLNFLFKLNLTIYKSSFKNIRRDLKCDSKIYYFTDKFKKY